MSLFEAVDIFGLLGSGSVHDFEYVLARLCCFAHHFGQGYRKFQQETGEGGGGGCFEQEGLCYPAVVLSWLATLRDLDGLFWNRSSLGGVRCME